MESGIFIYPYGTYYDPNLPESIEGSNAVIIYTNVKGVDRVIGSLEGIFVSLLPLEGEDEQTLCRRNHMEIFEKHYFGKFHKFPTD